MNRQYIGARYVTKVYENTLDPSSAEWQTGVTYEPLTLVTYNNSSYLSKKEVPGSIGDPASNPSYWVVTGAYNGQIAFLQSEIDRLKSKYYDVRDYGINPGENVYDALYDLLHDVVEPNGGGIVYFPAGNYTLDYTIFIPSNTTFIGDGDNTIITFDNSDTYIGVALAPAGSNITIANMDVRHASNVKYDINGPLPGAIGISDFDYTQYTSKREHAVHTHAGNANIEIINVNCHQCNYGIQIEPSTYLVSNVFIENHICETGMLSLQGNANTTLVKNVYINNVICDTLRAGIGYEATENINIDGIYCTQMAIRTNNVKVSHFHVHSDPGNRIANSSGYESAIIASMDNIVLSDGIISRSADSLQTRIINGYTRTSPANIFLNNIEVEDPSAFTNGMQTVDYYNFYYSNINFDPYSGYETVDMSTFSAQVNPRIRFNCSKGLSYLKGYFYYAFGNTQTEDIGNVNSNILNTKVLPSNYIISNGMLVNPATPSTPPEPVIVKLVSDGSISVFRPLNTSNTYTGILIDLTW